MTKNRTSTHRGKSGSARHNEHRFYEKDNRDVTLHSFIHQKENTACDMTFDEMKFYERYTQQLNKQNEKYLQQRQYKRVKSLEDFYKSDRYKPTEEILQYGHAGGDVPDGETYEKMTIEYARRKVEWSMKHGNHLHVLDYANHYDEATPHTHLREIWDYQDDEGILRVSQEESMKRAGLDLPDPSKPAGRYNNRSMTYTKMCREMWQDVCEQFGYAVERVPLEHGRKKSETVAEYHARKGRELEDREKGITEKEQVLNTREQDLNSLKTSLFDRERALNEKQEEYKVNYLKRRKELERREKTIIQKEQDLSKYAKVLMERIDVYECKLDNIQKIDDARRREAHEKAQSDRRYAEALANITASTSDNDYGFGR